MRVLMISRPTVLTVPGGDTVQMLETSKALQQSGVEVVIHSGEQTPEYGKFDLLHFFNVIRPNSISHHVRSSGLPYVISTIFVDYSEVELLHRGRLFRWLSKLCGPDGVDYIKTLARVLKNGESIGDAGYLWRGHRKSVERLLNGAALLLPNSKSEFRRLKQRYRFENEYRVIPNGVSEDFLNESIPEENTRKGVVCVGRIEVIKNQLNLIRALRNSDIPLTIIGKAAPNHPDYYELCRKESGSNVRFLGQLDRNEVIRELKNARVHALPSFFETTGLSSLEAAAVGCNIVISNRGDQTEYFEKEAIYCEPENPTSILEAITIALKNPPDERLRMRIRDNFTWKKAAKETAEAYQLAISRQRPR